MKKFILAVTVNPAIDQIIGVIKGQPCRNSDGRRVAMIAGGKGVNVSRLLKKLSVSCLSTGFLGGDSGRRFQQLLNQEGLLHDFIRISRPTRTNLTILDYSLKKTMRAFGQSPTVNKFELRNFKIKYQKLIKKASCVILSGSNIPGAGHDVYAGLIDGARRSHVPAVLDASNEALIKGYKARPYLVKLNQQEAEAFFQIRMSSIMKIKSALRHLFSAGIKIPVITLAEKGAVLYNGRDFLRAYPLRSWDIQSFGGGDAFLGGFLYGEINGWLVSKSLRFAAAAGFCQVRSQGSWNFSRKNIFAAYEQTKLQYL